MATTGILYMHKDASSQYCGLFELANPPPDSGNVVFYSQAIKGWKKNVRVQDTTRSAVLKRTATNRWEFVPINNTIASDGTMVFVGTTSFHGEVLEDGIEYAIKPIGSTDATVSPVKLGSRFTDFVVNYNSTNTWSDLWQIAGQGRVQYPIPDTLYEGMTYLACLDVYIETVSNTSYSVEVNDTVVYTAPDLSIGSTNNLPCIFFTFVYQPGQTVTFICTNVNSIHGLCIAFVPVAP